MRRLATVALVLVLLVGCVSSRSMEDIHKSASELEAAWKVLRPNLKPAPQDNRDTPEDITAVMDKFGEALEAHVKATGPLEEEPGE